MAAKIAEYLLETNSVQVNIKKPFKLVSGRLSPVYVDCRRLISYPKIRDEITAQFAKIAQEEIGLDKIDLIAGGETAGIPYAAFLACKLNKPMIYVRKSPKGHGKLSQIEGVLENGQRVLLVEDLVTDGESKLNFKKGIEVSGGILKDILCVFEYKCDKVGLREAREKLLKHGIKLYSLATWDDILDIATAKGYFTEEEQKQILDFLRDPQGWSIKMESSRVH